MSDVPVHWGPRRRGSGPVRRWRAAALTGVLAAALLLPGCASTVKVHPVSPRRTYRWLAAAAPVSGQPSAGTLQVLRLHGLAGLWNADPDLVLTTLDRLPHPGRDVRFATVEIALLRARHAGLEEDGRTQGLYLDAARRAWAYLFAPPADGMDPAFDRHALAAALAYDEAVARVVELLRSRGAVLEGGLGIPLPGGGTTILAPAGGRWHLADFSALAAVDRLAIKGFENRFTRFGIGAPFVGLIPPGSGTPGSRFYPPKGLAVPVTAVIRFPADGSAAKARLALLDARSTGSVRIAGRRIPVAADFTAPYAYLASLGERDIRRIGSVGMFSPGATGSLHRMILMEPFDPAKIPLVLVHGLRSDPSIWLPLTNELEGDPLLRKKYQVWYFLYPSGEPFLWTAAMFRDSLDRVRSTLDPGGASHALDAMVLVGHSMGGLLVKTTVSASGNRLWNTIFTVPPGKLPLAQDQAAAIEKALFFTPKPYVHRVIFMSTPQHGSRMAASLVGELGSALVQLPRSFSGMLRRLARDDPGAITPEMRVLFEKGGADAVRALRPDNPVMQAFASLPIAPGIPFHTIIGDRGLDGGEEASDGVVSWKSAHLDGAASEIVVHCDHHSTTDPQAIRAVLRILRANLGKR